MKPDRSRPKSVFAEHIRLDAHIEALRRNAADEVIKPETASAPEDLSESAGPANKVLGHGIDSPKNRVDGPPQNEAADTKVDLPTDMSKEDSASALQHVAADTAAEDPSAEVEEFSPNVNTEEPAGASLTNQTDALFIDPISRSTVQAAQTTEDGKETIATSTSSPKNTKISAKAAVPKILADHLTGCSISDDMNPIPIVNASVDYMALLSEDNQTRSGSLEETSTITSPENAQNHSDSLSSFPHVEVEDHRPLAATPDATSPTDLHWSPRFSLGAQKPDVTVNEQSSTCLTRPQRENIYSKEDNSNLSESARSEPRKKPLIESPFAQRRRYSVRLSLEELSPEEITEASIVFHNYTGTKGTEPTSEAPLDQLQSQDTTEDTCQPSPRANPIAVAEGGETQEEPVEVTKGKTRSGARFSDDTNMLKDFLSRAQARKLTQPSILPTSAPKPLASPRRTPRKALAELDSNSPSTQRHSDIANRPGTPPGRGKLGIIDFDNVEEGAPEPTSCRRSTRTRSPAPPKATAGAPSFIPVRRADGTDPVVLQKSAAQELTIVTRANTRRNKGQAKIPSLTLQNLPTEGLELISVKHGKKDAKSVGWDEKLLYFHDVTELTVDEEEKRPRVRRLRGLGAVNGTPAPKKMMADINIGTPAPKRRGKVR